MFQKKIRTKIYPPLEGQAANSFLFLIYIYRERVIIHKQISNLAHINKKYLFGSLIGFNTNSIEKKDEGRHLFSNFVGKGFNHLTELNVPLNPEVHIYIILLYFIYNIFIFIFKKC